MFELSVATPLSNLDPAVVAQRSQNVAELDRHITVKPTRCFCALLAVVLFLFCVPFTDGADAAPKLRTMTYNLHGNLGTQDGTYSGAAIASVISAQNPDVVGLQEVCASQLADLRSRLVAAGYAYTQHYVTVTGTSCGGFGIGFLSKLPLDDPTTTVLPTYNEKRAVIGATVEQGGVQVRVFNSHASPGAGITHTQPIADETLTTSLARRIVMGDFNVNTSNTAALAPFSGRSLTEVDPLEPADLTGQQPDQQDRLHLHVLADHHRLERGPEHDRLRPSAGRREPRSGRRPAADGRADRLHVGARRQQRDLPGPLRRDGDDAADEPGDERLDARVERGRHQDRLHVEPRWRQRDLRHER